jgi:hypothetical protein
MPVDEVLLRQATRAHERFLASQHEADRAQVSYQHAIRSLHASGASLREIADALGLSYQRVHQIVDPSSGKGALKDATTESMCAFCGREKIDAGRLIAGPGLFICERCVDLAGEALAEGHERCDDRTHDRDRGSRRPEGTLRLLRQATKPCRWHCRGADAPAGRQGRPAPAPWRANLRRLRLVVRGDPRGARRVT